MTIARRAATGTVLLVGSTIVSQVLGLVELMVLARLLDPAAFGTFALARFFFDILQRLRQLWVGYFVIREEEITEGFLATVMGVQVLIGGAVILLALLGAPLLRGFHGSLLALVFLAITAAALFDEVGLGSIPLALLERDFCYRQVVAVGLSGKALGLTVAIALAWAGLGVWALVAEQATISLATFLGYSASVGYPLYSAWWGLWKLFDRKRARRLLRTHGVYLWVLGVGYWLTFSLGDYLVGSMVGLAALGYYTRGYALSSFQIGILGSLTRVMFPVYSRLREETGQVAAAYRLTMGLIIRASVFTAVVLFAAAGPIVNVVLGPGWQPAVPVVQSLIAFQVARPIVDGLGSLLMALGHLRRYSMVTLGAAGLMGVLGVQTTARFGPIGTAVALGLATTWVAWALHRQLPTEVRSLFREVFSRPVLIGSGAIALSLALSYVLPDGGSFWLTMLARMIVPIGAFSIVLILTERRSLSSAIGFIAKTLAGEET